MDKTDTLITKSTINAVTGGQDFVAVDIATQPLQGNGLALVAWVKGKNVIREVRCLINDGE